MRLWLAVLLLLATPSMAGMQVRRIAMYSGAAVCGNNIRDGSELCDGADLGTGVCGNQGFTAGVLACKNDGSCTYDTSRCGDLLMFVTFENNGPDTTSPYTLLQSGAAREFSAGDATGDFLDTAGSGDPGAATAAAAGKVGSYGLAIQGDATLNSEMTFAVVSEDIIKVGQGSVGMWFQARDDVAVIPLMFKTGGGGGSNAIAAYYFGHSTGFPDAVVLDIYDGTNTADCQTNDDAITVGAWYFIEFKWNTSVDANCASGHCEVVKITDTSDVTVTTTCTGTAMVPLANPPVTLHLGINNAKNANIYIDNFMVSAKYATDLTALRNTVLSPQ